MFEDVAKFIKQGNLKALKKLPDSGMINADLKSFLHISAEEEQIEISKILLNYGLDINQKDKTGKTPFSIVCSKQNEELFDLFFDHKPELNTQDNHGNTPLHNAIFNKNILGKLLNRNPNPYLKNSFGLPVLHSASDNLDTLEFLLKKDVHPNSMNNYEQTLLHTASIDENMQLSDKLLEYGAEINFRDKYGKTPLFYSKNDNMLKYWLEKGANPNITDKEGKTALFELITKGDVKSVLTLLKHKAYVNIVDKNNKSSLLYTNNNVIRKLFAVRGRSKY